MIFIVVKYLLVITVKRKFAISEKSVKKIRIKIACFFRTFLLTLKYIIRGIFCWSPGQHGRQVFVRPCA